jgi:hypothetical protein
MTPHRVGPLDRGDGAERNFAQTAFSEVRIQHLCVAPVLC